MIGRVTLSVPWFLRIALGCVLIVMSLVLGFRLYAKIHSLEEAEYDEFVDSRIDDRSPLLAQSPDRSQPSGSGYLPGTNRTSNYGV